MLSKFNRCGILFCLVLVEMLISITTAKANDSDLVNCNRAWKIVVMGSSTAFGTGASTYDSSWTGRYLGYIKRRNPNSEIINLAVPGITTYQNLRPDNYTPPIDRPVPISGNNITAALALQPDAIIINMPSNDANNYYSLEEQQANFEAAIYLADSANVPVWVTTSQPRNNMTPEQIGLLTSFRDWVFVRFGDKAVNFWADVANPDGSIVDFYDYDYVHVNNNGHSLFFSRMAAASILDSLCNRYTGTLTVDAGPDTIITLPVSSYAVPLTAVSSVGSVQNYSWRKIAGPSSFSFLNENSATPVIANLIEGRYSFEITVSDDRGNMVKDTLGIVLQSRVLIDFGQTATNNPDANGNYWNNILNANEGVKLSNAITVGNISSGLNVEVVNRIDGSFNIAGPGVNTGNTTGDVVDYPASATTDYAFAHPSTDTGLWRISGLDSLKEYRIKFWGSRTVTDARVIEIKMSDDLVWQSYDAQNNVNYDQAAVFTFSGKSNVDFNIRVAAGSSFGHIGLIDIFRTSSTASVNILPHANAGNDITIVIPENTANLDGTASIDDDGDIVAYAWRKIAGPQNYSIANANAAQTSVSNLTEGSYQFELKVTDDKGGIGLDTVNVIVGTRILIDLGPTITASPDAEGKYWNQVTNATNGVKLLNTVTTQNVFSSVGLEVINRIDGSFNIAGPGVNTGNAIGDVGDYPSTATTDYAFAEPSATNGQWKIFGLDSNKTYTIKFWGTRSVADPRFIEIKLNNDENWQTYNAANNSDFNQAATFVITGKSEAVFDIRVPSGSSFGYISVIDIFKYNNPSNTNLPPQAVAGADVNLTLPASSITLNGSNSSDPDGFINAYHWTKITGPDSYQIVSPDSAITDINNLAEGTYQFELLVTDDNGLTDRDTVIVRVSSRILFDFGATLTPLPDANGNYWNNITTANEGVKLNNAVTVSNESTGISMEVISRIDGTFNLAGPGVNTGNTIGDVGDYLNSATTDYAFAHPSATNGKWKFAGLDSTKQYSIKFWGTRSTSDPRVIEIKTEQDAEWKSYNALNNANYEEAAVFTIVRKKEVIFDIRVQAGSSFGHISLVDINMTTPIVTCLPDTTNEVVSACGSYNWNGNTYTASGTYTFNTTNANGCDSTTTLELTINTATSSNEVVSACGSYNWNGNTYTASGIYTFNTTNANGCDSTATLELTINTATSSNEVVSACGSYNWNGNTYTASGIYTFNTTNANGCDSTATLELTINTATSSNEVVSACGSYNWNGNTYTASGIYTFNTTNANGCDSTATLELTINTATSSNEVVSACGSYNWNGNTYTASGIYTFNTTNANGCDSTATLELTINTATNSNEVVSACGSYNWNGNTYTASGIYTFNTTNANGCDSTATLELTINTATNSNEVVSACGSYNWNGNTYTASGIYTFNTTNANGCDSTATLELTINTATNSNEVVSACGSYNWNGNTYTASGIYTFNTTNANGCDSTATLELTINTATSSNEVVSACGSYNWNGNTYTASGTYTFNTTNANGCDSTATLELTINTATSSNEVVSACGSYNWNGNTYTASGTYTFNTTNANGCDSTATLELTINTATSSNEVVSACGSYNWNGNTYTASGTYTFNATNANGCDSTATLELTINTTTSSNEVVSACGSYNWNGNTYSASGIYTFNTTNANGCDSTATLELTINTATNSNEVVSACGSYNWNGNNYTASGIYTFNTTNANGCDSTATLELTINTATNSNEVVSACGSYNWNGNAYTASGTYTFNTTNANGCDSTATLELTINTATSSNEVVSACGSYNWNGNTYTASGTYTFNTTNANGCDSTATLELTINTATNSNEVVSACGSYNWNGNTYTASGIYTFNTTNANGCDSTATLELTINTATNSNEVVSACGSYNWNGNTYTASGIYTFNTTNANGCDSTATLELTINTATSSNEVISTCDSYSWNGNTYTASGAYTFNTTNANGCDSTATLELTINTATSSNEVVSACGSYNWNGNTYTASGIYTFNTTNANGCDSIVTLELTIFPAPFSVGNISGPTNTCLYAGPLGQDATYTISAVNAASIEWEIPEDATIVSQTANSITVHFSLAFVAGSITATVSSPCGANQIRTLVLNGRTPASPGVINGPVNVCNFVGTQQVVNYSVASIPNVIYYKWVLPASVTLVSANQDSSSIAVVINNSFISLLNKTIKVQSVSGCGVSGFSSLTLSSSVPSVPSIISGPNNGCLYTSIDNLATYKINKVANATSYNWQVPLGVSIIAHPAGLGINDTIISVQFSTSFVSGAAITVNAVANCGAGLTRSFTLSKLSPSNPYAITGPTNVCSYLGNDSAVVYTIRRVAQANSYNWVVPSGVTISHPAGLGLNDTIVVLRFPAVFSSGTISVAAVNGCGTSSVTSLTLSNVVVATPVLSGPTDACQYIDTAAVYTIRKISGAISYNWVVPTAGVSSVNHPNGLGVNDTIIEVVYLPSFIRGTISVSAFSGCNTSGLRSLSVGRRLPSTPGVITSSVITAACPKRIYSYSISALPANSNAVVWTVPAGAFIDSGQGGLRIYVSYGPGAIVNQTVTVAGVNACATGSSRSTSVNLAACVVPPFAGNANTSSLKSISVGTAEVAPNPSTSFFKINLPVKNNLPVVIRVRNNVGKLMMENKMTAAAAPIILQAESWSNGLYYFEWSQGALKGVLKLIKL